MFAEACWPLTAKGLENALSSSGLSWSCFGRCLRDWKEYQVSEEIVLSSRCSRIILGDQGQNESFRFFMYFQE